MKRLEAIIILALVWGLFLPSYASYDLKNDATGPGDGVISLLNTHNGEFETIRYKADNGSYLADGIEKINALLRCRLTGREANMSLRLVELLDHIEDHFKASRIEIISGYRSPELNAALRRVSRRVARNSLHMEGMATDIRIPNVNLRELRDYAKNLHSGGVGYYPGNFVHIDIGKVRYW